LAYNDWLVVSAPAGSHVYSFRYLPWDVPVGLLITLVGIGFCVWLGRRKAPAAQEIEAAAGDENRANVDSPGDLEYP